MKFTIEDTLLRAVIDYLAKRPYIEVQKMIAELANLPKQNQAGEARDTPQQVPPK